MGWNQSCVSAGSLDVWAACGQLSALTCGAVGWSPTTTTSCCRYPRKPHQVRYARGTKVRHCDGIQIACPQTSATRPLKCSNRYQRPIKCCVIHLLGHDTTTNAVSARRCPTSSPG